MSLAFAMPKKSREAHSRYAVRCSMPWLEGTFPQLPFATDPFARHGADPIRHTAVLVLMRVRDVCADQVIKCMEHCPDWLRK